MAFGDEKEGTFFLWEVPQNLKQAQENEEENIQNFWDREVAKCLFVIKQREEKKEEFNLQKVEMEK